MEGGTSGQAFMYMNMNTSHEHEHFSWYQCVHLGVLIERGTSRQAFMYLRNKFRV